ncbi:MAG: helix-hairpin-helix domain-containing protein [Prevotella sp.]|nr:helix-hairpin-helix domain-containing protein [Prevotella sp.]
MKARIVLALMVMTLNVQAQSERAWTQYFNEVMTVEDVGTAQWEETYELLCELEQHPMDINQATREQLEQLPFLSAQQVEEIVEYLYRYGPMKSLAELQMLRSLDNERRRLLTYFIYIGESGTVDSRQHNYAHHELMATGRIPFYERKGGVDGYQGYPYRHWLKYQFTYGDQVKAGLVGSQDAGEPFFSGKNRLGYDYYSVWLQLKQLGRLESLVLGKYRVSMGMGLIINNSFSLGKVSMLQNMGRPTSTLRAHSSRSSDGYLQGAAATVRIARGLTATGFISYRAMDATLNKDGVTVSSIITSGYHRTETELEKKNNLKNTTFGGNVRYQTNGYHAGLNVVGTHLNRELKPNTSVLYRQHYAQGYDFLNVSVDYGYVHHRFSVNGETALNRDGALATINSLSLQLGSEWSLMALYRFYSYRYTSLYANSYCDGGSVQNESGIYLGATWQPTPSWKLMAYIDYAYFPWAKYQISQSSHSWDQLLQVSYSKKHWSFGGRYRLHIRQKDNDDKTALITRMEHRGRVSAEYSRVWSSKTQVDFGFTSFKEHEKGLMVSETLGFTHRWLRLNGGMGYFHTDSYDSRVYLYELGPLYSYSVTQFSGEGIRYWLIARANIGSRLMLTAKLGITNYFDRSTIGSSYQQINRSSQTDLDLQVRWKF